MKAPTLYHGNSLSGLIKLIQQRRLPSDKRWGVVGDFSPVKKVAVDFAEKAYYPKTPEDKVGVLVKFKPDFAEKAKLRPIKYNTHWLNKNEEVKFHIVEFNPDVMDYEDERDALPSAKLLAYEKEWVGDNAEFPIGEAIDKIMVVDGKKQDLNLVKKALPSFPIETISKEKVQQDWRKAWFKAHPHKQSFKS